MDDWLEPLESLETPSYSFIVNIRFAPGGAGSEKAGWRGSVEHVQSHERIYFNEFVRLNHFIAVCSGIPLPPLSWRTRFSEWWQKTGLSRLLDN